MTRASDLADCILSGQVPDDRVPSLVAETPGLRQELERRSAAMSSAHPGEAGRGASISSPDGLRPADLTTPVMPDDDGFYRSALRLDRLGPVNLLDLRRKPALPHGLGEQVGRRPFKIGGLLSQLIRSSHPASFLRKLWRQ